MKLFDKFLKKLKVNRNTFATYILTLITVYLAVDRIVEMLLMIFTGVSVSYWGPIAYTFALACPVFAYLFAPASSFATSKNMKVTLFNVFVIGFYIIALSMITQWLNFFAWLLFMYVPNYSEIVVEFADLVKPAFTALALYLPLVITPKIVKWLILGFNDNKDNKRSVWDYKGISLADKKSGHGPYSCDVYVCSDKETGKKITFPESKRYQSLLVCGGSGSGKTSLVFEPMMARDLERKYFFTEMSKEMGFTALKTGIAVLTKPYNNDYLNKNFSLTMLTPKSEKESVYKTYMKKMLLSSSPDYIYKNIGVTYVTPDYDSIAHMTDVCKNFHIGYNLIDPSDSESNGLNPFVYDDPLKVAITISSILNCMHNRAHASNEKKESYQVDTSSQAVENLAILLSEMYPRIHEGALPNLEDVYKMLSNFDLVEKMCEILKTNHNLEERYASQLVYFEKHFYKDGKKRAETEKAVAPAIVELETLLRIPGVKNVLCNRHQNINCDELLAEGGITFVCTRRGDIGAPAHKAFGLFFLISMQNAILRRPGNESNRVPNFMYIDEFPDFICKETEAMFTMYRKYKVGTIISAQNLAQLETKELGLNYRQTILANTASKIFTGIGIPEDLKWWSEEFGKKRDWKYSNSMDMSKLKYDSKYGGVKWDWTDYFKPNKLNSLKFKYCAYKIKSSDGKSQVGEGKLDFIPSKFKEAQPIKNYNFGKYISGISDEEDDSSRKKKFNPKNVDFTDNRNEIDPVQTDTTDSSFLFDNDNAVIFNFKKGKKGGN